MKNFVKKLVKDKEKVPTIESGTIVILVAQSQSVDFYDLKVNGLYYSSVPCPIPINVQEQLKYDQPKGIQITQNRKMLLQRKPLFAPNESVQVIFEGSNKSSIKISIENSIIKFEKTKIIYI
jgi:hypothetical protein